MASSAKSVRRIQENFVAFQERRVLNWLCARLPKWATPDGLTVIGFAGMIAVAAAYALSNYHTAWLAVVVVGFAVNWFGDSLDGSLARFRKIERPNYGYFVDHSLDALGNFLLVVGLGASPYVRMEVALAAGGAYLLLSIHTFLAARVIDEFRLTFLNGGPTEMRLILIAMTVAMFVMGPRASLVDGFSVFDIAVGVIGTILLMLFVAQTATTGRMLHRLGK